MTLGAWSYIKQLGKGPGKTTTTKKAGPRRLALAQPQKYQLKDPFRRQLEKIIWNKPENPSPGKPWPFFKNFVVFLLFLVEQDVAPGM